MTGAARQAGGQLAGLAITPGAAYLARKATSVYDSVLKLIPSLEENPLVEIGVDALMEKARSLEENLMMKRHPGSPRVNGRNRQNSQ